ncbi:hypothetical protein CCAX7_27990 [Capsulimonas corticalis]|uniref:Uncharacterized protein n=1 Tax=Capsulimonas corticalis TaxID=2219043 RepID=A0A402CTH0_9BACT|nr:nuclear transport factor 2 family protein [Capsulimonas corticalis]BDI30748.1 hypothetical protein CCAX7_27990 [Capsulimonas corticalis]
MDTKTLLLIACAGALLAGAACPPAGAIGVSAARQAIQASYRRFTVAESRLSYPPIKDASEAFLAPDFTLHTATGHTLNLGEFLKEMELTTHEVVKVHEDRFQTTGLRRQGSTITETGIYTFVRKALDVDAYYGKKNLPHLVSERMPYRAIWILIDGRWRLRTLSLLSDKLVVDGKPHPVV